MTFFREVIGKLKGRDEFPTRTQGKTADEWLEIADKAANTLKLADSNYDRALQADWRKDRDAFTRHYGELDRSPRPGSSEPVQTEEEWRREQVKQAWQTGARPPQRQERW